MATRVAIFVILAVAGGFVGRSLWKDYEFESHAVLVFGTVTKVEIRDRQALALVRVTPHGASQPLLVWVHSMTSRSSVELTDAQRFGTAVKLACVYAGSGYQCRAFGDRESDRPGSPVPFLLIGVPVAILVWLSRRRSSRSAQRQS